MSKSVVKRAKRIFSVLLAVTTIFTSFSMPQATIEAEAETVVSANYYLVDGLEGTTIKVPDNSNGKYDFKGVVWDEEEQCAVFDGESWLEISNPFPEVSAETGFYFSFEAYVSSENNNSGKFINSKGKETDKNGWQRILDISDGTIDNYFFFNAGTSDPLNVCLRYKGGVEYETNFGKGYERNYMDAWHKFTLVVTPYDGWTIYMDGNSLATKDPDTTITQVLNDMATYNTCYVGTSVYETVGKYFDGFFIGKMRNLTFASTSDIMFLSYDANGGEPINGSSIATSVAICLPEHFPQVSKDGYVFAGWYTDEACTQKAVESAAMDFDTTLYAKWHQHDWEYISEGGTLKACCHTEDCPAEASAPNYISMTLSGSDQSYIESNMDKASIFSIDGYEDFNKNTGATADVSQIKIYAADADGNKTGSDLSGSPIEVGSYVAELEVTTAAGVQTIAVPISYSKVAPVVSAPTAKTGLIYDGSAQELINAGSTAHGTISYKLESDDDFATTIPKAIKPGNYKVIYKVTGDKNHNDVDEKSINVTIGKKPITVGITAQDKVYDGNTKATIEHTVPSGDLCGSDKIVITGLKANFSDANAGRNKTVTVDDSGATVTGTNSDYYVLTYSTAKAEIKKANHTVSPSGIEGVATTIQGKPDGKLDKLPDAPTEYRLKGAGDYTESTVGSITGLAAGTYEIRFKETTNQNASPALEVVVTDGSKLAIKLPVASAQVGYSITASPAAIAWDESSTLTLTVKPGYNTDTDFAVKKDGVTLAKTDLGGNRYSFTVPANSDTAVITVEGVKDKTAPTGTITIGAKSCTTFTEDQTFGYFQSGRADISVTAQDEGTGIAEVGGIAYYLSDIARSEASLKADGGITWVNSDSFSVMPGNKKFVYVRLMDESGNTTYLSLDKGIVVFRDSALSSDAITYSRTATGTDTSVGITLNGNTIKEVKCTDGAGTVLASGTDYVLDSENGTLTFKSSFLQTLTAGKDYDIVISYYPLGVDNGAAAAPTNGTLTISSVKTAGAVTITADISKAYDGNPANKDDALINKTGTGYTTDNTTGDSKVTIEYKEKTASDATYASVAPTSTGSYTVRVTVAADDNYTEAVATKDFTITQGTRADAPAGVGSVAATILGRPDGKLTGIPAGTEYRLKGSTEFKTVAGTSVTGLLAGTYEIRFRETTNQLPSPVSEVTIADGEKVTITLPDVSIREGYTITAEPATIGWNETSTLTLTLKQGYSLTKDFHVYLNMVELAKTDKGNGEYEFAIPANQTAATVIVTGVKDVTAPTGKITYGDVESTTFVDNQTFGYFSGNTVNLTVTASDEAGNLPPGGGISYYLSDSALTLSQVKKISSWTSGSSISIAPGNKKFVYVKLSDIKGNDSYISLDKGVVCFAESSVANSTIHYDKTKTGHDVVEGLTLNGNTINKIRLNDGLGRDLVKDTDYVISIVDGSIIFKPAFLQSLAASPSHYELEISYYPLGIISGVAERPASSIVDLYISRSNGSVTITADLTKDYDGEPVNKDNALIDKTGTGYTTDSATGDSKVTIEYKEKSAADSAYSEVAPVDVGEYTVRVTIAEDDNYKTAVGTKNFEIKQGTRSDTPAGIGSVATTILNKEDGKLTGLVADAMEYRLKGTGVYTVATSSTIDNLAAGTYEVRFTETTNQKASPTSEVIIASGAKVQIILPTKQEGYTITASPASIAWDESSTLVLTLEQGYSIDSDFIVKLNGGKLEATEIEDGKYSFTVPANSASAVITVAGINDMTPPTGAIKLGDNSCETFTEGQTFGYFLGKEAKLTITAQDAVSGMAEVGGIAYYLSDSVLSKASLESDSTIAWNSGSSISIKPGEKKFVYVRLMDANGNVGFISLDKGVVVYNEASVDESAFDYTRTKNGNDESVNISLNGNTIKEVKCMDGDGSVLTADTDYVYDEVASTVTFKASFLQTLVAGETHEINISYYPLGEDNGESEGPVASVISINVKKSQGTLTDIADLTKDYDGEPVNKDFAIIDKAGNGYSTDNVTGDSTVTIEYKKKNDADTEYSTVAPSKADDYTVRVTVAEDDNYTEAVATKDFKINKVKAGGTAVITLADTELTYGSSTSGLVNVAGDIVGGELKLAIVARDEDVSDDAWTDVLSDNLNVGDYDVYYKIIGDENHDDTNPSLIGGLRVQPKEVGLEWSDVVRFVYNGQEQKPEVNVMATDIVGEDICEINVSEAGIHAGTYTAEVVGLSNDNYIIKSDAVCSKDYEIVAKELTLSVEDAEIVYADVIPDFVIKAEGLVEGDKLSDILTCELEVGGDIEDDGMHDIVIKADAVSSSTDYIIVNGSAGTKLGTLNILAPGPVAWITFDFNGGELASSTEKNVKFYEGEAFNKTANKLAELNPTRDGYKFVGWYKDAKMNYIMPEGEVIDGAMTLYAGWAYRATKGETAENTDMYISVIQDAIYTGGAIKPTVTVTDGTTVLTPNKDYKISYGNNVKANAGGKYVETNGLSFTDGKVVPDNFDPKLPFVIIKGVGNYTSTIKMNFNILPKDISNVDTDTEMNMFLNETIKYAPRAVPGPGLVLKYNSNVTGGSKLMKLNKDYKFEYEACEGATPVVSPVKLAKGAKGQYKFTITGINDFNGTIVRTLTITDDVTSLNSARVTIDRIALTNNDEPLTADKLNVKVSIKVGKDNVDLVRDEDYTVDYVGPAPIKPGAYSVKITAKPGSAYIDSKTVKLTVGGADTKYVTVENIPSVVYDGRYHGTSVVSVTVGKGEDARVLTPNEDYTLSYTSRKNTGVIWTTIYGVGAYKNMKKRSAACEIKRYNIATNADGLFAVTEQTEASKYSYRGATANPIVKFRGETLTLGKDYTIRYKNNKNVGTGTYEIIGIGNFIGTLEKKPFEITQFRLDEPGNVTYKCGAINYKAGGAIKPTFSIINKLDGNTALRQNRDYGNIRYSVDGVPCTTMPAMGTKLTITVTGKGNYVGDYSFEVPISGTSLASAGVVSVARIYTTEAILLRDGDVQLTYKLKNDDEAAIFNADGGRSVLTVVNRERVFSDVSTDLKKGDTILLENGKDYDLSGATYSKNIFVGAGKADIPGLGYFGGTKTVTFRINKKIIQWFS
ncbi:MAG: InlB B-repeat-containing protein [Lachnospiraceae bacterium]|nr:InlB B-repeat-containing protein [Candidatus Colinaster scatohippi]